MEGVTADDGAESYPVPAMFAAATTNVYELPLVNPEITFVVPVPRNATVV